jgi:SAM-dependent methyltransferase
VNKEFARRVLGYCGRAPVLRGVLVNLHRARSHKHPWMRRHPFDAAYGINTSVSLPGWLIASGTQADVHTTGYAGCQPSAVRDALSAIPDLERRTFVDLGCGKGRALVIASEFPFKSIFGVELSPDLVAEARRNIAVVKGKFPQRAKIEVAEGDAMVVPFPEGDLVIFLFHPFHRELVSVMLARLEVAARRSNREIFIIYENPVYGDAIDEAPWLQRWYSKKVAYYPEEIGYSLGNGEPVVIWRNGAGVAGSSSSTVGREILEN